MGCVETKEQPSEELAIIFAEKGLIFHLQSAKRTDSIMRKYSFNSKLNRFQLKRVSQELGISIKSYGLHRHITEMYDLLKGGDGDYRLQDMLVIGILLGKADNKQKARLLFQIFDSVSENKISFQVLKNDIIPCILSHCCNTLPRLVCNRQSNMANEIRNLIYVEKLKNATARCVNFICSNMANSKLVIIEEMFIRFFVTFRDGMLLTPSGVRLYMLEVADSNIDVALPRKKSESRSA